MPSSIKYIPPTTPERNGFTSAISAERRIRRDRYRKALDYYEGEHDPQLVKEDNQPDDNTYINLVKMTADRTVAFLFPKTPVIETDPTTVEPTEEELFIKRFLEENGSLSALSKIALRGFLSGHNFVRVKPPTKRKGMTTARMIPLDPTTVSIYWRADDVADVLWYETRYYVGADLYIEDFVYQEASDTWIIYTYRKKGSYNPLTDIVPTRHGEAGSLYNLDGVEFDGANFELVGTARHDYHIPPIIEWEHLPHPDDRYGMGEFTQQDLQDTINRIASERNRIVRENSDPVDVITGADAEEIINEGGLVTIANSQARATRLELKGDLSGITTVLDKLIETYLAIARVVLLKGEAKDLQRVTNASVRTLFLDALSKNELLQNTYGFALGRICKLALMMGYASGELASNPEELQPTIKFETPLPIDLTEIANINAIMVGMGGRSLRTASTAMGDDWAFEVSAMEAEDDFSIARQKKRMEAFPPVEGSNPDSTGENETGSNSPIDNPQ